ncbi:MAG TPA: right-handed parallel beta-helix repeat-containing protein [Vicinamibacterales bacterium]|jgi:hypothetical protein
MGTSSRVLSLVALGCALGIAGPASSQTTRYVSTAGADSGACTSTPCRTIQYAVDQATPGDHVKVAADLYTATHEDGTQRQVVSIKNAVTITGGYTTTNWTTPDAAANPVILDGSFIYTIVPLAGSLQADETVTGGTSGATAQVGYAYTLTPGTGTFQLSETVTGGTSGAVGNYVDVVGNRVAIAVTSGSFQNNELITGATSGATATIVSQRLLMVGRLVTIMGATVTVDGLQLIHGNSTESGTCPFGFSAPYGGSGGGIYIANATVMLHTLRIENNIGSNAYSQGSGALIPWNGEQNGAGGGLFATASNVTLTDSVLRANNSNTRFYGSGDAIYVQNSVLVARHNQFLDNLGGGESGWQGYYTPVGTVYTGGTAATLVENTFSRNGGAPPNNGGTVIVVSGTGAGPVEVTDNRFINNVGAVISWTGTVTVRRNLMTDNPGGGIGIGNKGYGLIENNLFLNNGSDGADGTAIHHGNWATVNDPLTTFNHNTIAGSRGNSAVYVWSGTADFRNNIVAGSTLGFDVRNQYLKRLSLRQTLFDGNGADISGSVTEDVGHIDGPAAFDVDGYHLTSTSAAVDAGSDVGVIDDIDGAVPKRPQGRAPDIGADESPFSRPYTGAAFGLTKTASKPRLLTWWPDNASAPSHRIGQEFLIALSNPTTAPTSASFSMTDTFPADLVFSGESHASGMSFARAGSDLSWHATTNLAPGGIAWASIVGEAGPEDVRKTITNQATADFTLTDGTGGTLTASAGATRIKGAHLNELRQRIDQLRTRVGLGTHPWTDDTLVPGVIVIKVAHLTEMRAALDDVYTHEGRRAPAYTPPSPVAGGTPMCR